MLQTKGGFQYTPTHMLATVLLSDHLKDLGSMADAVEQSLQLVVTEELVAHLSQAGGIGGISNSIPSIATLYVFDSCLTCVQWSFRAKTSSLAQAVGPVTYAQIQAHNSAKTILSQRLIMWTSPASNSMVMADMRHHVCRRILPLQLVGGRAASAAHKALRLMMSIGADAEDVDCALARCYSLAFDMGTERTLFTAPALKAKPQMRVWFQLWVTGQVLRHWT